MGKVIIDNWNLTNAKITIKNEEEIPNDIYMEILSTLVLWDEIYYLDEGLSTFGWLDSNVGRKMKPLLKPLVIESKKKDIFEKSADLQYQKKYREYKKIIAQRAIYYHEISKVYGLNYFPVNDRANFLKEHVNSRELWSRRELLDIEEKEILERVYNFNLSQSSFIPFPLLHSLIIKNTNSSDNYIETTLQIKQSKEVVTFRKYMDEIDMQLNKGNDSELKYVLKMIPEIVDDIQKMDRKLKLTTELKLKVSPGVISMATLALLSAIYSQNELLSMGLLCSTIGQALSDSNFEISKSFENIYHPKKIQTNFLRTLAKNYIK